MRKENFCSMHFKLPGYVSNIVEAIAVCKDIFDGDYDERLTCPKTTESLLKHDKKQLRKAALKQMNL